MSKTADPRLPDPSRWKALAFIALAQLMVVLDATIVNIALPLRPEDLGISDGNRQWVITAYALAFGGLLLFGGRIADLWGRKRTFVVGLIGFAAGLRARWRGPERGACCSAPAPSRVSSARCSRPAALSLLAVMFTDAKERAKAFGIYGAIAGGGGAVGLILGGFLTEYLNWRWTFFVNIPFAIVAAVGCVLRHPRAGRRPQPLAARHPRRRPLHPRSGLAGLRLHPRRVRRLVGPADHRPVRRLGGAARRVRPHRVQGQVPAAAAARRDRAQPRRCLPLARPRHHRDVRPVPLPDLLPAGREGLLADQDRLRLPADDRGHDHRLHADRRPADDPGRRRAC